MMKTLSKNSFIRILLDPRVKDETLILCHPVSLMNRVLIYIHVFSVCVLYIHVFSVCVLYIHVFLVCAHVQPCMYHSHVELRGNTQGSVLTLQHVGL